MLESSVPKLKGVQAKEREKQDPNKASASWSPPQNARMTFGM